MKKEIIGMEPQQSDMFSPEIFPEDIKYTLEHVWVRDLENVVEVGISCFAEQQLGEIVYISLPEPGTHFDSDEEFGTVESMKSVSGLYCPCAGTVVEINSALEDTPGLLNDDPYGKGWMIRLVSDQPEKNTQLLSAQAYAELIPG